MVTVTILRRVLKTEAEKLFPSTECLIVCGKNKIGKGLSMKFHLKLTTQMELKKGERIDPLGRPNSAHCFRMCCPSAYSHFSKSRKTKQSENNDPYLVRL